jgi:hypothetical protein
MQQPANFQINFGGRTYTYYAQQSTGSPGSTTIISFNPTIPSPNSIINRLMYTQIQYTLTFHGSGTGPLLQIGTMDGPRFLPTVNATNNVQIVLNGVPFTVPMDAVQGMARYWVKPQDARDTLSCTAAQFDGYQDIAACQVYGPARNALAAYGEQSDVAMPRGGMVSMIVQQNSNTDAVVLLNVIEPLFVPPLSQKIDGPGLSQIKTFTVTLNMNPTLNRIWQHAPPLTTAGSIVNPFTGGGVVAVGTAAAPLVGGNTIATMVVSIATAPQLLFHVITPQEGRGMPRILTYDYSMWTTIPLDYPDLITPVLTAVNNGTLTGGAGSAQVTHSTNSIQLNTIPDEIYLWVADQFQDKTNTGLVLCGGASTVSPTSVFAGDGAARIDYLQITFNNEPALLQTTQIWDRYNFCLRNGFQGTYADFCQHWGSFMCIRPGIDFGLPPGLAPGMTGVWNIVMTVGYTNVSDQAKRFSIYMTPRTFGVMKIEAGMVTQTIGLVSQNMVDKAMANPTGMYMSPFMSNSVGIGGDVFGSIKKLHHDHIAPHLTFGNAARLARFAMPYVNKYVVPYARKRLGFGAGLGEPVGMGSGFQQSDEYNGHESIGMEMDEEDEKRREETEGPQRDFRNEEAADEPVRGSGIPSSTQYMTGASLKRNREQAGSQMMTAQQQQQRDRQQNSISFS